MPTVPPQSCFIFTYTVYTHIDGLSGSRCEDAALISFPPLCLICSPLPLLAGPSEIALPLHTPSIHKVRRAEFITSHWGEMQSGEIYLLFFSFFFYKWYQIGEREVCHLWNCWSSGSFLSRLGDREMLSERSNWGEKKNEKVFGSACVRRLFLFSVINCCRQSCQGRLRVHLLWWRQTQKLSAGHIKPNLRANSGVCWGSLHFKWLCFFCPLFHTEDGFLLNVICQTLLLFIHPRLSQSHGHYENWCILLISLFRLARVLIGVVTASAVSRMCDGGGVASRGEGRRVGWGVRWTR